MGIRWRHDDVWRFLLKHGTRYENVSDPYGYIATCEAPWSTAKKRPKQFLPKQCFRNAWILSFVTNGVLEYTEGVATLKATFAEEVATPHAWCTSPEGYVVDPTPRWRDSFKHPNPFYFGIPFGNEFTEMARHCQNKKSYGKSTLTHLSLIQGKLESYPGVADHATYSRYLERRRHQCRAIQKYEMGRNTSQQTCQTGSKL